MMTIREELVKWRDEDVDAETYITDSEIDALEKIVKNITLEVSLRQVEVVNVWR